MTHTISKSFGFSASHQLGGLPDGHKCGRLHGHSYELRVELSGSTDNVGFVIDFGELEWVNRFVSSTLDHRHLNDVIEVNPTSENLATWVAARVAEWLSGRPERARITELVVTVAESRSSFASTRISLT